MAKVLLSVRISDELMGEIDAIAAKTKRDRTAITTELLQRGLEGIQDKPITTANYATIEDMEALKAELMREIEAVKELEPLG